MCYITQDALWVLHKSLMNLGSIHLALSFHPHKVFTHYPGSLEGPAIRWKLTFFNTYCLKLTFLPDYCKRAIRAI